jgi:hypothetical protein
MGRVAAHSMASVIDATPATDAARPRPGKTYMLLHCDGMSVRPSGSVTCHTGELLRRSCSDEESKQGLRPAGVTVA